MRVLKFNNLFVCTFVLVLCGTATAPGDWDPCDPHKMHYPQLPDLEPTGMDVLAGPRIVDPNDLVQYEKFLADDFECTRSGPITGIHIWGSYNQDLVLDADPSFSLVIYENIPADSCYPFSRPGAVLWDAYLRPSAMRVYAWDVNEYFYDPNPDLIVGWDTQAWQFNFDIDEAEAFVQDRGQIYWLGVHHTYDLDGNGSVNFSDSIVLKDNWPAGPFGWKTSGVEQFEDNAVWTDVDTFFSTEPHVAPEGEIWTPLVYPEGHQFETLSMDLAFVISGGEAPTCWDITECAGQPVGDATCDGSIDFADLAALKMSFFFVYPDPSYNCCADFDHSNNVNFADLAILKANFFTTGYSPSTGNQNCPP